MGNPDETVEDMRATFDFAAQLPLDTFGFNRLCVYRGTPLWQEYVKRGLVNRSDRLVQILQMFGDRSDLPLGETINRVRQQVLKSCFSISSSIIPSRPFNSFIALSVYAGAEVGLSSSSSPSWAEERRYQSRSGLALVVEHADMKDAAAQLTQLSDERLLDVLETARQERLGLQRDAEQRRELPMVPAG